MRGIKVIGTIKESVSGPQNDQKFSKNLGHVPLTKAQPHYTVLSQSLLLNVRTGSEIDKSRPMVDTAMGSNSLSH